MASRKEPLNLTDLPEWLTPEEVQRVLRIHRGGVYEAIRAGQLPQYESGAATASARARWKQSP